MEQLDAVFDALQGDVNQGANAVLDLETKVMAAESRVERRTSKTQFNVLNANVDEHQTKTAGIQEQSKELSRVVRGVQEQVFNLRDPASTRTSSDVVISDVLSDLDMFNSAVEHHRRLSSDSDEHSGGVPTRDRPQAPVESRSGEVISSYNAKTPIVEIRSKHRETQNNASLVRFTVTA